MTVNLQAVAENEHNRTCVKLTHGGGVTTLSIDKNKATYRGVPAVLLTADQKKKLENVILFMFIESLQQVPLIKYV